MPNLGTAVLVYRRLCQRKVIAIGTARLSLSLTIHEIKTLGKTDSKTAKSKWGSSAAVASTIPLTQIS